MKSKVIRQIRHNGMDGTDRTGATNKTGGMKRQSMEGNDMSVAKLTDQMRQAWGRMNGAHVLAVLCALYETVIVTRLLLVPNIANPTLRSAMTASAWALPVFVLIVIVAVIGIWFCRRRPLSMLLLETALFLLVSVLYGSAFSYLSLPWAIALYFAVTGIESLPLRICALVAAGLLGSVSVALATVWRQDAGLTNFLYPFVLLYVVFVVSGVMVRSYRERRQSERALLNEQERGEKLTVQRDKAMKQSRIAAELHDSVGHDLTAIIALSEGLEGVSDKPEMNDAINMINDLARQGLTDTRTAVKALQPDSHANSDEDAGEENPQGAERNVGIAENARFQGSEADKAAEKFDIKRNENIGQDNGNRQNGDLSQESGTYKAFPLGRLHDWDDINPVLDHSRQIGITTVLTETGRRPQDPQQADLSFTITRESITNAIRHGQGVDRIVVSWDHDGQGGIAITVRDNGKPIDKSGQNGRGLSESGRENGKIEAKSGEYGDGTGLTRLKKGIEQVGGTFAAGPDTDGWTVKAYIPSLMGSANKQSQGGEQR
ncbi:histidine kinase [Bifidobacterium sp. ESL0769]|uniref:sensor histidine kinase n=1 Tax=Bifidobacterium sp. ESL0769 TaxID=2983229 RepID=UPI0023F98E5F|nr:histidine kinase [Bifidobacterium sp. ESL0769]WEV68030.1 histidine kinase [Bifidobacterium sp. ESL0769]